uniref:HAT C-terminal dimerisation domain-containing protein n=1 Tax=Amphiprion percula TaxID=161767 RepID=A0A3P8S973_AMPPE
PHSGEEMEEGEHHQDEEEEGEKDDMQGSDSERERRLPDPSLTISSRAEKKVEKESPTTLMEFTQFLDPYQDVFYEMFRLCKIVVVLPVSSAFREQSFSSLRLIKTYLRSTMTEKRLSSLAVLSIESKCTKALDLDKFVKHFAEQHGNRRIQLL